MRTILTYILWLLKKTLWMIGKVFQWSANDPAADARRNALAISMVGDGLSWDKVPPKMLGTDVKKLSNRSVCTLYNRKF